MANGRREGGGAHVSGTEGSPNGRPRCYRRVPGGVHGWVAGSRAVGGSYWESIPVSAPLRPRDKCTATFVVARCLMSPATPPAVGVGHCTPPKNKNYATSVNDCESFTPGGVEMSTQRRLTFQSPRGRNGGGGARDRQEAAMVPCGTKASPVRPRPHPPLPLTRPTSETNEGTPLTCQGGLPRGEDRSSGQVQGAYAPPCLLDLPPLGA